jgi:hypothetical protein
MLMIEFKVLHMLYHQNTSPAPGFLLRHDQVLLNNPSWPGTSHAAQNGIKLTILLPLRP